MTCVYVNDGHVEFAFHYTYLPFNYISSSFILAEANSTVQLDVWQNKLLQACRICAMFFFFFLGGGCHINRSEC